MLQSYLFEVSMTVLGLDLGTKTLGVAISRTGIIANPYKLLKYNNEEYDKLALEVADIVKKESIEKINLTQKGMEYASEMIILSKINNLKMLEVPTILRKDLRENKSHLRTIRDGIRHLNLICTIAFNKDKYRVEDGKYRTSEEREN